MPPIPTTSYRLALGLALAAITWLALAPAMETPGHSDKLNHVIAFVTLAWLSDRAFPFTTRLIVPVGLLLLYGAGLELIQHPLPHRTGSWADFLANAMGLILYFSVKKFYATTEKPTP